MTYLVQKRKKGSDNWETVSTYDTKSKAITECNWLAQHFIPAEECKKLPLTWEYRVINDAVVVLLQYKISNNKRVKTYIRPYPL
jgi:hypothetical protein